MTTTHRPARPSRHLTVVAAAVLGLAGLAACSSEAEDADVASLADTTADGAADASAAASGGTSSPAATGDLEEELLAYTSCLRDQGVDVPDVEVDADGNVQLGGPGGQAGDGDGDQAGGPAAIDPEEFQAAQEVCGDPPSGLSSQLDQFDSPEFQDALLAFTQCLRDKGYDVDDIDLGSGGPGQAVAQQNPLGDLDLSDPTVSGDVDECQSTAFEGVDVPLPGGSN